MSEMHTCMSCGLTHSLVECRGIFHCPNKACAVSGNAGFRMTLPSYRENGDGSHSVDGREWALAAMTESHEDPAIAAAIDKSALKLLKAGSEGGGDE